MSAAALDLAPWSHNGTLGGFVEYPRIDIDSLHLHFTKPIDETIDRRGKTTRPPWPVALRLNGPTGGVRTFVDPARLHAEADRLHAAADALAELQAAYPPAEATLALQS